LKPMAGKLSSFMRRLLTGYAVTFNLRHRRSGHLFQNRYKSIVCEEDSYLLELVRYIHLNPLRVGLVPDVKALSKYRWTGHSVIMGRQTLDGQNIGEVLSYFGNKTKAAREAYCRFIADGAGQGNRNELVGGGLLRVKKSLVDDHPMMYDERILGSGAFVQYLVEKCGVGGIEKPVLDLPDILGRVADFLGVTVGEISEVGRSKAVSKARSIVSYVGYRKMGHSGEDVARILGITRSGVCRRAEAGEELFRGNEELKKLFQD
jgi:putative transposase